MQLDRALYREEAAKVLGIPFDELIQQLDSGFIINGEFNSVWLCVCDCNTATLKVLVAGGQSCKRQ